MLSILSNLSNLLVRYTAVFSVVTQCSSPLYRCNLRAAKHQNFPKTYGVRSGTISILRFRGLGNTSSLRKLFFESLSVVFVSSGLPFDCATYLGRYLMYRDIHCTDFTFITYTFPFLLGTLLLCYLVTLLLYCHFLILV